MNEFGILKKNENLIYPIPTQRAVIDPLRYCNIKCKFCYNLHSNNNFIKSFNQVSKEIDDAKLRGNNYIDVTGGEPTFYPYIIDLIKYALSKNMKTCIITNGIISKSKIMKLIEAGIDEFLISVHGLENTHDKLVQLKGARNSQTELLNILMENNISLRFNFVLTCLNQEEIYETTKWMAQWKPKIINFININPHREWKIYLNEMKELVSDLDVVSEQLCKSIDYAENKNIGINIRYFPMCKINEKYRRCICNDLHVLFDPYEWDYCIYPKTYLKFKLEAFRHSYSTELKSNPCNKCQLLLICGGINKWLYKIINKKILQPIKDSNLTDIEKKDFYYYRKYNFLTLKPKVPYDFNVFKQNLNTRNGFKNKLLLLFYESKIIQYIEDLYQLTINYNNEPTKSFYERFLKLLKKNILF